MMKVLLYTTLILFAASAAFAWWKLVKRPRRGRVVLGSEMARAMEVERAHVAENRDPSPIEGLSYNNWDQGHQLFMLQPTSVDAEVRSFLGDFRGASSDERDDTRRRLRMDDFYTLFHFGKRSAVLALRQQDPKRCEDGLVALAAIDPSRVDVRDIQWTMGVLGAAARWIGADQSALFQAVSPLAEENLAAALSNRLVSKPQGATFEGNGFSVVETPAGIGLVESDSSKYEPQTDLLKVAVCAFESLSSTRYQKATFTIGTEIAPVWLGAKGEDVLAALRKANGTAKLSLSPKDDGARFRELFLIYFAEFESSDEANWLSKIAPNEEVGERSTVSFAVGKVVCVGVAKSRTRDVRCVESTKSLAKLLDPIKQIVSEMTRH